MKKKIFLILCLCFSVMLPSEKMFAGEVFTISKSQMRSMMEKAKKKLRKMQNAFVKEKEKEAREKERKKEQKRRNRVEINNGSLKIRGPGLRVIRFGTTSIPETYIFGPQPYPGPIEPPEPPEPFEPPEPPEPPEPIFDSGAE